VEQYGFILCNYLCSLIKTCRTLRQENGKEGVAHENILLRTRETFH
jgi:hypothetical protein